MPNKTISKDIPLSEITLRRYEKPYNMPRRELIRKLCLSIGLLQVGDSRDVIVDIFQVLLSAKDKSIVLDSESIKKEVIALRKKSQLPLKGIASSNVRRQLKRLRDLSLIEKIKNEYRITEFEELPVIFEEKIKKYHLDSVLKRVEEYFKALK
ncbi:MAG TPA: hypothetical protein VJB94_02560 [Candidatus Nanoarchaeia archaeon]|nr:hypothetical protein [Candidatus Nanoarchaeia archaeon]